MSQPNPIDVVVPSGDAQADHALLDDIRRVPGREEIANTITRSGFNMRDRLSQPTISSSRSGSRTSGSRRITWSSTRPGLAADSMQDRVTEAPE